MLSESDRIEKCAFSRPKATNRTVSKHFSKVDWQFYDFCSINDNGMSPFSFTFIVLGSNWQSRSSDYHQRAFIGEKVMAANPSSRGQGLVEYAMILMLVAIVVIVVLALLGPAVGNMFSNVMAGI
jgi:pilus assembly protein Flp/PilA